MSDFFGFTERYLTADGKEYIDANSVREALDIVDEYVDIFGVIKKLKEERDELKEKCDKMKKRANAMYGTSCGYSGDKTPAFLCDVISYSWEPGCFCYSGTTLNDDGHISVELYLTPNANYEWIFDPEDLRQYIQAYGREKKLGVVESIDYQNAKAARAELAYLYKTVLGKEKLDRDLSPHEVMKAILDAVKKLRDAQFASDQCLRSVYMHIYEGTGYDISDIYAAPDKIADWIITRYDSTKKLSHMETLCDINDFIDELCDKYNVVQPERSKTTRERLDYIFSVLADYRGMHDKEWDRIEELIKEKRTVEDPLAELRAKIREIYRSVVDDEWDGRLSYTSAMNDINEEYKRIVHNFEERTADWHKTQQDLDRYKLAVGSLLDIPKGSRDDINAIERSFDLTSKKYVSLKEFRDSVCEILDIPSSMADDQEQILKEIHDFADRYYELRDFRADICEVLGIDADELFGSPQQNDQYILEQVEKLKKTPNRDTFRDAICNALGMPTTSINGNIIGRIHMRQDCHNKLCKDYTELRKAIWEAMDRKPETLPEETARLVGEVAELARGEKLLIEFRDAVAKAIGMDYPTTNNFILKRVSDIYKERGESHDLAMELDRKCIDLTAKNSDLKQKFDFQSGLRQQWHARYESEHERANDVQKALDREREKSRVKDISLETAKKQYEKVCGNLETAECALNGMKSKVRSLQEEKNKVISALGQDIWDDAVK